MLETYYMWKKYPSVNYRNDKDYIGNELRTSGVYIVSLQTDLGNLHNNNNYNSKFKYPHVIRGNNSNQLTEHIKIILSHESETMISSNNEGYFGKYAQYILTTDSQDIINNNSPHEEREQIDKYKRSVCSIDYKYAVNYNKHIRGGDTCSIFY